jgi:acyl-CoA thioesterase-1
MRPFLVFTLALASCAPSGNSDASVRGEIGDRVASSHSDSAAARPAPVIPTDAPLVVFLGDSISAGLHLPANLAFPAVLQADLARREHPFRLVNAGVSGDTSAGGLARLEWIVKQKPAVVVIELGGNDALRGQDLAAIETNLRAIVTKVREGGAKVLLLGMRISPSYGKEYSEGFAEIYARIAQDMNVPLVPYFMERVGGVPEMTLPDGLHPAARGHEILAENVAPKLIEVLSR